MDWNIEAGRPVYLQLIEQLELAIVTGVLPAGSKVPPVRELAAQAGVNPNTMQRALQELETRGLMKSQRTAGRTVCAGTEQLDGLRRQRAEALAEEFWKQMQALGISAEETAALLRAAAEKENV